MKDFRVTEEAFSPQKRTSSTSKHKNLNFFLFLWVIFDLLDPDPDSESGYGSTDLTESGSRSETLEKRLTFPTKTASSVGLPGVMMAMCRPDPPNSAAQLPRPAL